MRHQKIWEILGLSWWWLLVATWGEEALRGAIHFESLQVLSVLGLWAYVQAGWLKSGMRQSRTLYFYLGTDILAVIAEVCDRFHANHLIVWTLYVVILIGAIGSAFLFRSEFQTYINRDASPWLQIKLSPWMTLFFSVLYFQYHFQQLYKEQRAEALSASPISSE